MSRDVAAREAPGRISGERQAEAGAHNGGRAGQNTRRAVQALVNVPFPQRWEQREGSAEE